jgi:heme/copper-type cytochrome/quinol oxidase subunit 3
MYLNFFRGIWPAALAPAFVWLAKIGSRETAIPPSLLAFVAVLWISGSFVYLATVQMRQRDRAADTAIALGLAAVLGALILAAVKWGLEARGLRM